MPDDHDNPSNSGSASWASLHNLLAPIAWDWPGWLPRGFLTVLAAEPGAGKSALCLSLAACYLSRRPWPDDAPFDADSASAARGAVLWCESEASHFLNLQRARQWDLDLSRILSPFKNPLHNFKLDNPAHREALLRLARRDRVRLVILDSLRGLRSSSRHSMPINELLLWLADAARLSGKPILLTHHLRKRTTLDHDGRVTVDRLLGASAVAQTARVIWALDAPDPAEPTHRRLSVIKNNLGPFPDPLGMRIDAKGPRFGPAPRPPVATSEFDRAVHFLRQRLAAGPLPFNRLRAEYLAAGFSERTIRRAKRHLAIISLRPTNQTEWHWTLPREIH